MSVTWLAGLLGAGVVVAVACLALMFIVGQPFGTINDVANAVIGIVAALLALAVLRTFGGSPLWTALAVAGAIVVVIGSWLVISGTTGFMLAGFVSAVGYSLIGAWVIVACRATPLGEALATGTQVIGLVAGAAMVVGVIGLAGVLMRVDSFEATPPWLWLYSVGWIGTYFLLPAWSILVATSGVAG